MDPQELPAIEITSEVVGPGEMQPTAKPYQDRASSREYIILHYPPDIITRTIATTYGARVKISEGSPTAQGMVRGTFEGPIDVYVHDYDSIGDEMVQKAATYNPDTGAVTGTGDQGKAEPRFSVSVVMGENLPAFKQRVRGQHRTGSVEVIRASDARFEIDTSIRVEEEAYDPTQAEDLGRQALTTTLGQLGAVLNKGIAYYSH